MSQNFKVISGVTFFSVVLYMLFNASLHLLSIADDFFVLVGFLLLTVTTVAACMLLMFIIEQIRFNLRSHRN